MIRQVRLYSGTDGQSHVEESWLAMSPAATGSDQLTEWIDAGPVRFQESPAGSALDWHVAPHGQFVITLSGTLEFITRDGETFRLGAGDVLLAEDTAGSGHRWRLVDDQPW